MLQKIIRKLEKKLRHWPPAAADAFLGRCDYMRVLRTGVRQSVASRRVRLNLSRLPGSLLVTIHSTVRTPVMGRSSASASRIGHHGAIQMLYYYYYYYPKSNVKCRLKVYGWTSNNIIVQMVEDNRRSVR